MQIEDLRGIVACAHLGIFGCVGIRHRNRRPLLRHLHLTGRHYEQLILQIQRDPLPEQPERIKQDKLPDLHLHNAAGHGVERQPHALTVVCKHRHLKSQVAALSGQAVRIGQRDQRLRCGKNTIICDLQHPLEQLSLPDRLLAVKELHLHGFLHVKQPEQQNQRE